MTPAPRGLGVYRDVLGVPGAPLFVGSGLVARLPISMMGIGIVLLVEGAYGSYAVAGALAAVYAVVSSACSPLLARAVDRLGQARVMRPAVAVHLTGLVALLVLASARAPVPALVAAVVVTGTSYGSFGSLVRARWLHVLTGPQALAGPGRPGEAVTPGDEVDDVEAEVVGGVAPGTAPAAVLRREQRVGTAFSLESVLDEVVFMTGPLIVTTAAAAVSPVLGLGVAALAVGGGGALLLAQRSTEPPPSPDRPERGTAVLRARGMLVLLTAFVALGGMFGAVEVVTVALADDQGVPVAAGAVLAAYALGSLVAGLAYGAVTWRGPARRRFAVGAVCLGLTTLPAVLATSVVALGVVLVVAGCAISPTLIAGNALVRDVVAPTRLTEGLTWLSTALGGGVAAGAAVGGQWVDTAGPGSALALPPLFAVTAVVVVLAGYRRLGRAY